MSWICIAAFTALAAVSAVCFFRAEEVRAMIGWAGGFVAALLAVGLWKVWYWMELNRNAVTRAVRRVELQLARLAARLGKHG